ncbi:MAG TPA: glycosyl hydrolase, partial [Kineosporiaceae bacterium]|nr:glycosyl hydrolase [Kineosporiaceae bacterium]
MSGASGTDVSNGGFSQWRGSPVTIAGTWDDTDAASQTALPSLTGEYAGWPHAVDVAVGGTVLGSDESYAQAAHGDYTDRWTQMAKHLQHARANSTGPTFVRPWHEFNGDWYKNWQVTPDNVADYKTSFRLMVGIIRQYCPGCLIVWGANNSTSAGSSTIADAYPGDDVVDVIGDDSYNANGAPVVTDDTSWQHYSSQVDGAGNPVGPAAWLAFAASHGKPLGFPEWGLNAGGGGGDNPYYIQAMHDFFTTRAAGPSDTNLAGKVIYDVYFDVPQAPGFTIGQGDNPTASAQYRSLPWGDQATARNGPAGTPAPTSTAATADGLGGVLLGTTPETAPAPSTPPADQSATTTASQPSSDATDAPPIAAATASAAATTAPRTRPPAPLTPADTPVTPASAPAGLP